MIEDELQLASVISHAIEHDENSHFHFSRFLILLNEHNIPIAAGCAFPSPPCGLFESKTGLCKAMTAIIPNCSEKEANERWEKGIYFLLDAYPNIDWENTWVIDCLYTIPAHRGHGYGRTILNALYEQGHRNPLCRIQCKDQHDPNSNSNSKEDESKSKSESIDIDTVSFFDKSILACVVGNNTARSLYIKNGYVDSLGVGNSDKCMSILGCSGFEMLSRPYV